MVYYAYHTMTITYPKGDSDSSANLNPPASASHLTAVAIAVSIVFLVVAAGLWYGFSQSKKAVESVPAAVIPLPASPAVEGARVYEAIDGLQQCQKNTPDLNTADAQKKRQNCYYAVMTIFATSSICNIIALDGSSSDLCKQAEARFIKDYPNGIPKTDIPLVGAKTNANSNPSVPGSGGSAGLGTKGSTGSTGGSGGINSNTNTQSNTNTGSQNTNTNSTSNANTSGNTNTAGNSNSSTSQNSNNNSNQNETSNDLPPCLNDGGEPTLLQHTNCQ